MIILCYKVIISTIFMWKVVCHAVTPSHSADKAPSPSPVPWRQDSAQGLTDKARKILKATDLQKIASSPKPQKVVKSAYFSKSMYLSWNTVQWESNIITVNPNIISIGRTPIDQSAGKVRENKSLATSLSTWQTKDYYFNGKFYLKTLNPKIAWWRHLLYIWNIFLLMMNVGEIPATCESQEWSLGAILTW